jgi:hypothetical protein
LRTTGEFHKAITVECLAVHRRRHQWQDAKHPVMFPN